jgi:excisionase family DNA binding protein
MANLYSAVNDRRRGRAAGSDWSCSSGMTPLCRGVTAIGVIAIGQVIPLALGVMVPSAGVSPQPDTEGSARTTRRSPIKVVVGEGEPVELPIESLKTLHKVVHALAGGNDAMLTTTEAADFLGVSRPYLTRLLKSGKLPYRKKGNRHIVPAEALGRFKAERDRQLNELDELAAAEEDLGVR